MNRSLWDIADLNENDRIIGNIEYKGPLSLSSNIICGISTSACSLIRSIVNGSNPIGYLILTENQVLNPIDYSFGSDPLLQFMQSKRFDVFFYNGITFITIDSEIICPNKCVDLIFDKFNPIKIIVLTSIHFSFIKSIENPPILYNLNYPLNNSTLIAPNIITGISAGLLIKSELFKINCNILYLIEEDSGPTIQSFSLWTNEILKEINLNNIEEINKKALDIYLLYQNDLGLIYT